MVLYLQWIGCVVGVLGAYLLALNNRRSGWGFVSFLMSNVCWMAFGLLTKAPGMVFMQVAFTATSLLGIYRWMSPFAFRRPPTFARESASPHRVAGRP